MKEDLNLQCPYNVTVDTVTSVYSFTTKQNHLYNAAFLQYGDMFLDTSAKPHAPDIYMFNLDIKSAVAKFAPRDPDIFLTVCCIFEHFFKNVNRVIVYLCDPNDNRERSRYRLFNMWYAHYTGSDAFRKISRTIYTPDKVMYTAMVIHKNNNNTIPLIKGYREVVAELQKPKPE